MFEDLLEDIEFVFGSVTWTANSIPTFPSNYQGKIGDGLLEYVRLNVLPSNGEDYAYDASKKLSGLVAVKIFVKAGEGQSRTMAIASLLDISLQHKILPLGTNFGASYLSVEGLDPANKSLYSASYLIPFTKYGE